MMAAMERAHLAALVDHTLLRPEATPDEVAALCQEAVELGVAAVCVSPSMLPVPDVGRLAVASVVGFPSGAHQPTVKADEAEAAVEAGATELDVVANLGLVKAGAWAQVVDDLAAVRAAAPAPIVLKVIVESAVLSDDELVAACRAAVDAGADFVKTSTGFHPAGGATTAAVAAMRAAVGPDIGVKASGGIRDAATALAMVEAGATRLGCSATRAILDGLPGAGEARAR
jgi:deoxyribose-phosphate aldolase